MWNGNFWIYNFIVRCMITLMQSKNTAKKIFGQLTPKILIVSTYVSFHSFVFWVNKKREKKSRSAWQKSRQIFKTLKKSSVLCPHKLCFHLCFILLFNIYAMSENSCCFQIKQSCVRNTDVNIWKINGRFYLGVKHSHKKMKGAPLVQSHGFVNFFSQTFLN